VTGDDRDPRSDAELLAAHVAGDHDAFAELFRRHRDRLWAVALRTLSDREEAADALQEAMVSAFRRAGGFRGEAAVTTWLHRIVVNACLDRVRRRRPLPVDPLPGAGEDPTGLRLPEVPDGSDAAVTSLDVAAALGRLPVDQRAAIVLVDLEGYSVADAAAVLGVPVGTVKSRCARGRARLVPLLGHLVGRESPPGEPPTGAGTSDHGKAGPAPSAPSRRPGSGG
jgi:RNA polymerase sigma-70 factor (ECF subfamily)